MSRERWIRGALCLGAAVLLVWAWRAPGLRDAEGLLKGAFCLPLAVALAVAGLGLCAGGPLARAAPWLALALVGQALALQLVEAGRFVGYQHYAPFPKLLGSRADLLLLGGLALQASLVALGLRRLWPRLRAALCGVLSTPRWIAVALVFVATSATLSREVSRYASELLFASFVQAVNLANLLLVGTALRSRELADLESKLSALLGSGNPAKPGLDRLAWLGGTWVTAVAVVLAIFSYERHPHIPDEVAYIYQARYFAEGLLSMPLPPVPEAFDVDLMQFEEDRWYSPFPLGWPAMLAVGTILGVPWLVNPILNGVNVLLAYLLVLGLYDRATARLVSLLLCTSPWFLFMGMNFMAHTSTLTCALAAAVAVVRLQQSRRLVWAWLGGGAIGMASLIRPLDGFALAGVLGLCALGIRGHRARFAPLAILASGAIAVGALALPYNHHLTGDPTYFPVIAYFDHYYEPGAMDMGFGPNRGLGWTGVDPFHGHGPIDVLVNGNLNLFSVNVELHGWSSGSLLLAALFLASGRLRRSDWLVFGSVAFVVGLHSFYWFSGGPDFGARYWYLILPGCIILSARGAQILAERLESLAPGLAAAGVRLGVAAACLVAVLTFLPWRAIDKYPHYRAMRPGVRELAREHGFGRSLVLIRGQRHPDYASAMIYNALDLESAAPVFAWDRGPEIRERVVAAFPDRSVWIVNGPTITGRGFEVAAGPLSPERFTAPTRESTFEAPDPAAAAPDA